MFFSENKLRKLANLSDKITTSDIVNAINSIGFEVEEVNSFCKVENIKFGKVIKTYPNPNSNKLTVCEIEFSDKLRTIQTTAKNVKENCFLIAFIPGSKISGNEIKEKEMAGIVSEGMLASFSELGFDENLIPKSINDGILLFDQPFDLKIDPIKHFELDDQIIEVSILSNRSDAQSYEIFAQELAAYFHSKYNDDLLKIESKNLFKSQIKIETKNEFQLYGAEIKTNNFKLPIEEIMLLLKSNIKIDENDFVNFCNLTLIYTGVSLRAFDLDKIQTKKISINKENNVFYLNDSKDNISILAIETIANYLPNNNSQNVLFEFSQIDEKIVRDNIKSAKKTTLSSINNSRHISYGMISIAFAFITKYFDNCSELINKKETKEISINYDIEYVNKYAGFDISKKDKYKDAIKSLKILGFKFDSKKVIIPLIRHDISNMQNIVEEIFRFYNLNNFEAVQNKTTSSIIAKIDSIEKKISYLGYTQAWTYTLINDKDNEFNPFKFENIIKLKTFVSEEHNSIRNSIAISLLRVFDYNFKRNIKSLSLFDVGMINDKKAIIIASTEKTYIEIKEDIEKITNQKFQIINLENDYLHPNYNAGLILGGKIVGWIGKFNPFKINISPDIIFCEILEEIIYHPMNKFKEFDDQPLKERDITFEIKKDYENDMYLNQIEAIDGIFSIKLISTYEKNNVKKLTYKILMNEKALSEFEKIEWEK